MALPTDIALYIAATDLQELFIDKETGQPLSGGRIFFWKNDNRTSTKNVFQLTGGSTNAQFIALPNPITLSLTGTITDSNNNPVVPYYYPRDNTGGLELYYIAVENALGVSQFTRQFWPQAAINESSGSIIDQTASTATLSAGFTYICDNGNSEIVFTVPTSAALGDTYIIKGFSSGGWKVVLNPSQTAYIGNESTTVGTGSFQSFQPSDSVLIQCVKANTTFSVIPLQGNIILN